MTGVNEPIVIVTSVPQFHIRAQPPCTLTVMSAPTTDYRMEDVLYAERPEWSDVVPIPQYENIQPLAPIFYSPECMQHSNRPLLVC